MNRSQPHGAQSPIRQSHMWPSTRWAARRCPHSAHDWAIERWSRTTLPIPLATSAMTTRVQGGSILTPLHTSMMVVTSKWHAPDFLGVAGHDEGHQPSGPDYRREVTSTSRLTSSPSRMFATASGGSTIFTFDPSADRTVTSPLLRSTSVILPAS
jgi:hypothetical protein